MTVTLEDLLAGDDEESIKATQLGVLAAADPPFPVTWWGATSLPLVLVTADAKPLAKIAAQIPAIAKGGYRTLAEKEWLDLLLESEYGITRTPAGRTRRQIRLTDAGGAPLVISAARTYWIQNAEGLRFTNVSNGSLVALGTLDITFEAEEPGAKYNGATSAWSWVTTVPGVTLADGPDGITTPGVDAESDASYSERAGDQWSTIGAGANDEAMHVLPKLALKGTTFDGLVTRVTVEGRTPNPGMVRLTIAGDQTSGTGGATVFPSGAGTLLETVQNYIDPPSHLGKAPNCVDVVVRSARYKVIAIGGTAKYLASFTTLAAVTAAVEASLNELARTTPIGGGAPAAVRIAEIIERVMRPDGVTNYVPGVTTADVALASDEIPIFTFAALVWVAE